MDVGTTRLEYQDHFVKTRVNPTPFIKYSVLTSLRAEPHGNRGSISGWGRGGTEFSLHYCILTDAGARPVVYPMSTGDSLEPG
jgi:hypothetical protein